MPVYFIQAGLAGPVKIGWSARPEDRVRHLQVLHWETLRLLAQWPGDTSVEAMLKRRFAPYLLAGDWFFPGAALLEAAADPDLVAKLDRSALEAIWRKSGPPTSNKVALAAADIAAIGRPQHPAPSLATHDEARS